MRENEMLSVEADITQVLNTLENLGGKRSTVMRHILSGLGTAAKAQVRKSYKSYNLSKGTGALLKSLQRKVMRNGKAVVIKANARRDDKVLYGYALAKGSTITAKNKEYLTFQKDGKWIKVHSVTLPKRDFVEGPVKKYLGTTEFKAKVDELMNKEIAKIEKKNAQKEASK